MNINFWRNDATGVYYVVCGSLRCTRLSLDEALKMVRFFAEESLTTEDEYA